MPTYEPTTCACGCGKRFLPKSSHHRYAALSHAIRAKRARAALGLRGKQLAGDELFANPPKDDEEEKALSELIYARAEALREKRTYNYRPQGKGRVPADVPLVELGARRGRVG